MKRQNIVKSPKTEVHAYRCTEQEYTTLSALAKECGLSLSRYVVEVGINHSPRKRLTKEEMEVLNGIAVLRMYLVNVSNVISGKTDAEKLLYFHNREYMTWWIDASAQVIRALYEKMEYIKK